MAKQQPIVMEGVVTESLPNVMFRVKLEVNDVVILCHTCGNMKKNFIKILPGDKVKVEMSPYDMTKGRITQRMSDTRPAESNARSFNGKKRK